MPRPAFDVSLRQTLLDPRSPLNAEKLGACFVYPPWGSFVGHISGTSGGMRDIHWDRPGVAPGTREVPHWPNTRERYLGKFCEQGVPPWSHAVVLPRDLDTYRWRARPLATQPCGAVAARPKTKRAFEVAFIPKSGPSAKGPTTQRQDRQRKLRQGLYNRRIFEPVQSADGEEWYDADAYQPQEYKVPDENLMPTWYALMYVMMFDEVAHAAFSKTMARGRLGSIPKAQISKWAAKLKAKAKPWAKRR